MDIQAQKTGKAPAGIPSLRSVAVSRSAVAALEVLRVFLLCSAGFVLGRLFIFPRFLDPFVPSHADLYRYFVISQESWSSGVFRNPRPLMLVFLHVVGAAIHSPQPLWLILSFATACFVTSLVLLLEWLSGSRASILGILLYSIVIFTLPSSYQVDQLDYGGMLAGVISVLAMYVWWHYRDRSPSKALALSLLLYWFSVEMKPGFPAVMLLLALVQLYFRRDKNALFLVLGIAAVSALVVLKDRLLGSPFLIFSDSSAIYAVKFSPLQNLSASWEYLRYALPIEFLPGLSIAYLLFWNVRKVGAALLLGLLTLAIASVGTLALIPNRTMDLYSWYPGMLLCLPFLFIFPPRLRGWGAFNIWESRIKNAGLVICLIGTFAGLLSEIRLHSDAASYYRYIHDYNVRVLASFPRLREENLQFHFTESPRVLVSGLQGPVHPFRERRYILLLSPLSDNYILLLRNAEASWNAPSSGSIGPAIYTRDLNIDALDYYIIYDQAGNFSRVLSRNQVKAIPDWLRIPVLQCNADPFRQDQNPNTLQDIAACLDQAGESLAAVAFITNSDQGNLTPILHYYLGHAYQTMGRTALAREEYEAALGSGENPYFRQALESVGGK